jgi:probable phosphoglycerate mutase
MLLYLARHAQTASSAVDSFNGRGELPLTAHGQEQAQALGARLSGIRWEAVYRSPLHRTAQTAEAIAPGYPQRVLEGLIEIDYGAWEGLSAEEARRRDPERYAAWERTPSTVSPPGGETATQIAERALAALERIGRAHTQGPVLAVSHKATLRVLGAAITGAPLDGYRTRWPQDECALNLVELRPGRAPFLHLWNDTSHLGPDPGATTRSGH